MAICIDPFGRPVSPKERFRNFVFILYPESAPDNWLDLLNDLHIQIFVSPLHDKDLINESEEQKKPHFHILLMFDGKKSVAFVNDLVSHFNGPNFQVCQSVNSQARYFCHLDNPDKFRYDVADVLCLGGADYNFTIDNRSDDNRIFNEIIEFCEEKEVFSFYTLFMYAFYHNPEWCYILRAKYSLFFKAFFASKETTNKKAFLKIAHDSLLLPDKEHDKKITCRKCGFVGFYTDFSLIDFEHTGICKDCMRDF